MAITWTAAMQTRVANLLTQSAYSSLSTDDKGLIDGGVSVPSATPGGVAGDALNRVSQWAQWVAMGGLTPPAAFEAWVVIETCYLASLAIRPDRSDYFLKAAQREMVNALKTFSASPIDSAAAPSADAFSGTLANIRKFVVGYLSRLDPPVYLPIDQIDQAFVTATSRLWKQANWSFKRRSCVITVSTSSVVTHDLGGSVVIDTHATKVWRYTDSAGLGSSLRWAAADDMAEMRTVWTTAGRPQYFRIEKAGDTRTFKFAPAPDIEYTLRGEVYIDGPGTPASATATTVMDKFPTDFWPMIRKACLAEALEMTGHKNALSLQAQVQGEIDRLLPMFDDVGAPDNDQTVRDANRDVFEMTGSNDLGGSFT